MEKTFEELIEPLKIGGFEGWYSVEFISTGKVKELLQKVREATIAEIENKANEYGEIAIADYVSDMPTDRIKINR